MSDSTIDFEKAKKASKNMEKLRGLRVFDDGKDSTELIREFRDKRRRH